VIFEQLMPGQYAEGNVTDDWFCEDPNSPESRNDMREEYRSLHAVLFLLARNIYFFFRVGGRRESCLPPARSAGYGAKRRIRRPVPTRARVRRGF